jgi:hypothetical protein
VLRYGKILKGGEEMKKVIFGLLMISLVLTPTLVYAAQDMTGKVAVGAWGTTPVVKFHFSKDVSGSAGLSYASSSGSSTTSIVGKIDYNLAPVGTIQPTIGLFLNLFSGTTTVTTFGGTWGVSTFVQPNLALGFDIVAISNASMTGGTILQILPAALITASYYF